MYKKIILSIILLLVFGVGVQAQRQVTEVKAPSRTPGFRGSISLHTNLDPFTVYNWRSFGSCVGGMHSMRDYGMAISSMGVGLDGGFTGRWLILNLYGRANWGTSFVEGSNRQEHVDMMLYLNLGVRLLKLWWVELEVDGGFGACFPNIGHKNNINTEVKPYLNNTHMIAPIAATLWFGRCRTARHRVGLSLEYVFRLGKFSDLPPLPDAVGADELKSTPATINASLKYQF